MYSITRRILVFSLMAFCISACTDDEDEVNLSPQIEGQNFTVVENAAIGTSVGTVVASDPENDALSFDITEGNEANTFAINASSGELTVNGSIDFETSSMYALTIEVSDGNNSSTANVGILVTNVDENTAPTIQAQSFSVNENSEQGTSVGMIEAQDAEDDELTFTIVSGNTNNAFELNSTSGELIVQSKEALDFEENASFMIEVEVTDGVLTASAIITITLNDIDPEPLVTRQEIIQSLEEGYGLWKSYIEFTLLFDAVYSNVITSPSSDWDEVFDHSINTENTKVEELWNDGRSIIFLLNNVILSADEVLPEGTERDELTAQALIIRSNIYYTLISWFENVPIETGIQNSDVSQAFKEDVISLIKNDLASASNLLPNQWTGEDESNVNSSTADALLSRLLGDNLEFAEALNVTEGLINSGNYTLGGDGDPLNESNSELIWGFDQTGEAVFSSVFTKGDYVPLLRLTEVYLTNAQANLQIGNMESARNRINELRIRKGESEIGMGASFSDLQNAILELWRSEMNFEGNLFFALRLFEVAESEFAIGSFRLILPIPRSAINENENLVQNQGY